MVEAVGEAGAWAAGLLSIATGSLVRAQFKDTDAVSLAAPACLASLVVMSPEGKASLVFGVLAVVASMSGYTIQRRSWKRVLTGSVGSTALVVGIWSSLALAVGTVTATGGSMTARGITVAVLWSGAVTAYLATRSAVGGYWSRRLHGFVDLTTLLFTSITAVLVGSMFNSAGAVAAVVVAIPWILTNRLARSLTRAQRIEGLSIRAIGRLPEAAGLVETSHAADVEKLAVRLGTNVGITGRRLKDLAQAAALHEVGLVWVSQSGELSRSYSHRDVAGWGAEMVAAVPALARAGAIIGAQADPYRAPGGQPDPAHDLRSQIVNLACEVELLRANGFDEPDVLEAIHKQASYRFSPQLVSALVPLLEERHRD